MATRQDEREKPCRRWKRMHDDCQWDLLRDLRGGSKAMRKGETKWLPKEKGEDKSTYVQRLARNYLFPMFDDAVSEIASRPFSRDVQLKGADGLDARLVKMGENMDGAGLTLAALARQVLDDALEVGMSHMFVDMPRVASEDEKTAARDQAVVPTVTHIKGRDLYWWSVIEGADGKPTLAEIRWFEHAETLDGADEVKRIRIWRASGSWEILECDDKGTWQKKNEGTHDYPGIPLVTLYTQRLGFMHAKPPLLKLAEVNLAHWQSNADQRQILHYCRVPMLFKSGFPAEDLKNETVVGVQRSTGTTSEKANMRWVEHTGQSVKSGEEDLRRLEERGEYLAKKPYTREPSGDRTATDASIQASRMESEVQQWVRNTEAAMLESYRVGARWLAVELPAGFHVDIFSEFHIMMRGGQDQATLDAARARGDLSLKAWLSGTQSRGTIDPDLTVEQIAEDLDAERTLGFEPMGGMPPEPDPEPDPDDGGGGE